MKRTHGLSNTRLYKTYGNIRARCYNKNNPRYHNYGGRGIRMCDEWRNNPESFLFWAIDNGYKKGLSIERIDVNGDYCPENCRWISNNEQQLNRTNNRTISFLGQSKTLIEWSRDLSFNYKTVQKRLDSGMSVEDAFTIPTAKKRRDITDMVSGKLIAVSYSHTAGKRAYWNCKCTCGNSITTRSENIISGKSQSCGCSRLKKDKEG
jgi:hypothetical protein